MKSTLSLATNRLLVRPLITLCEGFSGYLKRVADQNGVANLRTFNLKIRNLFSQLSSMGLMPPEIDRSRMAYLKYLNVAYTSSTIKWNFEYARFCPQCFKENQIWRIEWEMVFFDTCPVHHCWLVDTCSACGKLLSWRREHYCFCDCGELLLNQPALASPQALNELCALLQSNFHIDGKPRHESNPFFALDIGELQRIIQFLGAYANVRNNARPQKISAINTLRTSWEITSCSAEIIMNWPQPFCTILNQIYKQSDSDLSRKHRLNQHFGNLYDYLYRELANNAFDFVRHAFEQYLVENWRGQFAKRNKRICDSAFDQSTWVPASVAARLGGMSLRTVKNKVTSGALIGEERTIHSTGRRYLSIQRSSIEQLNQQKSEWLDLVRTTQLLGLGKKRSSTICALLFEQSVPRNKSSSLPWKIKKTEVDELLIVCKDLQALSTINSSSISVGHIIRYWRWSDAEIVALIRDIQYRKLKLLGQASDSIGIASWIVSRNILKNWCELTFPKKDTGHKIVDVAKILGIKEEVAYFLCRRGFLHEDEIDSKRGKARSISQSTLTEFSDKYIFSTSICKCWNACPRTLLKIFRQHNILPISGPDIDHGRQYLFERTSELIALLPKVFCKRHSQR